MTTGRQLEDRIALVTGAARGIGKAIALRYAAEGALLVLADVADAADLLGTLRAGGTKALSFRIDITDGAAVQAMVDEVTDSFGPVDTLVNNAGIIARGTIMDLTLDAWKRVMDVNVNGTFNCCRAVVPSMMREGFGRILNISSIAGKMGDITAAPAYGASKGAINAFTKSLARQLAQFGVTVNAIAPHAIATEMSAQWSDEKRAQVISGIPLKRLGTPEEVAEAALFLVSDRAGFITGEILDLNGGAFMD